MRFRVVVLPDPEGPSKTSNSPDRTVKFRLVIAAMGPKLLLTFASDMSAAGTSARERSVPRRRSRSRMRAIKRLPSQRIHDADSPHLVLEHVREEYGRQDAQHGGRGQQCRLAPGGDE